MLDGHAGAQDTGVGMLSIVNLQGHIAWQRPEKQDQQQQQEEGPLCEALIDGVASS